MRFLLLSLLFLPLRLLFLRPAPRRRVVSILRSSLVTVAFDVLFLYGGDWQVLSRHLSVSITKAGPTRLRATGPGTVPARSPVIHRGRGGGGLPVGSFVEMAFGDAALEAAEGWAGDGSFAVRAGAGCVRWRGGRGGVVAHRKKQEGRGIASWFMRGWSFCCAIDRMATLACLTSASRPPDPEARRQLVREGTHVNISTSLVHFSNIDSAFLVERLPCIPY